MKLIEGICEYFQDLFKPCINSIYQDGELPIEYENKKVIKHKIYNAEWSLPLNDFKIQALYIDLSFDEDKSWILLLENSNFIYIFRNVDGESAIINKNKSLVPLEMSASLLSSFEQMIHMGFSWKPKSLSKELFNIALTVI